ncbi:MAG: hypothetical protein R3F07_08000 [Opitutaceae bacterium]
MRSRWFTLLFAGTTVVACAAAVYFLKQNEILRAELARLAETAQSVDQAGVGAVETPESIVPEVAPAPATAEPEPSVGPQRWGGPARRGRMEQFLSDPAMQASMRARAADRIERDFAGLFRALGLDEDTVDIFTELLAERETMRFQLNMRRRLAGDDPVAQEEVDLWWEEGQAGLEKSLGEVLGSENFDKFTYYEETLPQRRQVEELQRRLSYSGTPLGESQAEALVGVMASTQAQFNFTTDLAALPPPERAAVSQDQVSQYMAERRVLNETILSKAAAVLQPDQLEALAGQQIREMEQVERQAEIGVRMRGGFGRGP